MNASSSILTIGHSTHPLAAFVALLTQHSVTLLADVRSAPYSRFNPQFNREPLECHRTLLVARALVRRGIMVEHILADGRLESHEATLERLLDVVGPPHQDLFRSKDARNRTQGQERCRFAHDSTTKVLFPKPAPPEPKRAPA